MAEQYESVRTDKQKRKIDGKPASNVLVGLNSSSDSTSFSLDNGFEATLSSTLSNVNGLRIFGQPEVSIYVDSVDSNHALPGGSSLDETDYIWDARLDYGSSDTNNLVARVYILNVSGMTHTFYVYIRFRFLVESGSIS